ncbi:MAG: hypothetical protein KBS41_03115 [Oscillospiraceae bacterium]|nr:hypothetical protein [Candidatus Equicaccousia limihippi]
MKKLLAIILAAALICTVVITAGATPAGTVTITGSDSISVNGTADYTVSIADCPNVSSVGISVVLGDKFEIKADSAQWLKGGTLQAFFYDTKMGTLGMLASPDVNGDLFKLTLKATGVTAAAQDLKINVIGKNGGSEVFNVTQTKALSAVCTTHTFGSWSEKTAATCTAAKVEHRICETCSYEETKNVGSALGHDFGEWTEKVPATCTTKGTEERTCKRDCGLTGATETRDITAKGHDFGEWTVKVPATCTTKGTEERTCKRDCGEEGKTETRDIPAKGHALTDWEVVTPATCTEPGLQKCTCTRQGCEYEETLVIPAGHKFGEWEVVTPATTTKEGLEKRVCTVEGCGYEETRVIPMIKEDEPKDKPESPVTGSELPISLAVVVLVLSGAAFLAIKKVRG